MQCPGATLVFRSWNAAQQCCYTQTTRAAWMAARLPGRFDRLFCSCFQQYMWRFMGQASVMWSSRLISADLKRSSQVCSYSSGSPFHLLSQLTEPAPFGLCPEGPLWSCRTVVCTGTNHVLSTSSRPIRNKCSANMCGDTWISGGSLTGDPMQCCPRSMSSGTLLWRLHIAALDQTAMPLSDTVYPSGVTNLRSSTAANHLMKSQGNPGTLSW